ncbi:LysR family transcriptional regulator [Aeromonas media]|uniref:LysR family transcriptional regulator n=1 Tax=Aeromonas media TaxID=651 RepID=UPI0005B1FA63|nr:LysR family transcriptional regulator [Aeromonas media]
MDQLRRYAIFAAVVEAGTMTGAAKALGMTPSAVSQHIGQLESLLGLTLLHRSTRRLSLTEAGEVVWQGCQSLQQTLNQTELRLSEVRDSLLGEVRITAPVGMAGQPLALALSPLLQAHPGLCIQIIADDEKRDLIAERIDVALRVGSLPDSTLVARKLGQTRMLLCAAPAYLAQAGTPHTPADLERHNCLFYSLFRGGTQWRLHGPEGEVAITPRGNFEVNNSDAIHTALLAGLGIGNMPDFIVARDLAAGRLVPVLPGHALPEHGVWCVYPRRRHLPAKVEAWLAFLQERLGLR